MTEQKQSASDGHLHFTCSIVLIFRHHQHSRLIHQVGRNYSDQSINNSWWPQPIRSRARIKPQNLVWIKPLICVSFKSYKQKSQAPMTIKLTVIDFSKWSNVSSNRWTNGDNVRWTFALQGWIGFIMRIEHKHEQKARVS